MLNILFETSVLTGGHSARGIGTYTRQLISFLEKNEEISLVKTSTLDKTKKNKIDLIHYPFFDLFFDTLPLTSLKKRVVTIHDVIPLVFSEQYKPGIKGKLRFKKQKLALKSIDAVITDSKASKLDIVKYLGVPEQKVHVVYLASNPDLKAQDENMIKKVKRKNKLPNNYLLYVGDINYNKNIPQLIKMMKYLDDTDLKLVCLGRNFTPQSIPEWQWIETQLALSNVEDKVIFLNNVLTESIDELSAIYTGAVAYIQPSLYEGFGLPILEAMQCRTPVISTENSSLIEVGDNFVQFTQTDAESMALAVKEVLSWSKTKRIKVIREAFKWSKNFNWQKTADETAEVYRQLLNK